MPGGDAFSPLALTDGGIYDNLGFTKFIELENSKQTLCNFVIVSDGSGAFVKDVSRIYRTVISRTVRSTDILMRRLADETIRIAEAHGEKSCRLSISEDLPGSQFSSALQQALGTIRTDLDRFSDEEVALLFVRGYEVCTTKLSKLSSSKTQSPIYERLRSRIHSEDLPSLIYRSARRRVGFFNWRDWVTYAILYPCLILPLALLPLGIELAAYTQQRISDQGALIESLSAQVNNSIQSQGVSTPSSPNLAEQVNKADFKVFIQFAGYKREDIVALASDLGREWGVQGANRGGELLSSAAGLREVRFGPEADKPAATALAQDIESAAIGGGDVSLKRVVGIPQGTLELWIGLK